MRTNIIIFLVFPFLMNAQVSIPDTNFESELIAQGIDTDGVVNGQISTVDALAKTGALNIDNKGISDLTGIEAFINISQLRFDDNTVSSVDLSTLTGLTQLRCANNSLSSIDISNNTNLNILEIQNNSIASLDLSSNTNLTLLRCDNNSLSSIDISNNLLLDTLHCYSNNITSIDLSLNTALTQIRCDNNNITAIDVSNNTNLTILDVHDNSISVLDVSNNTNLSIIRCDNNNLTSLDVSNNTLLANLRCNANNIASLDLTSNTVLTEFRCQNNTGLSSLNVKNGNNTSITVFMANNNPSLTCIEVDDATYADTNFTKDPSATFSANCSVLSTNTLNPKNFKTYPLPINTHLNLIIPKDIIVTKISIMNLNGQVILHENFKTSLNIESINTGMYFIKLHTNKGDLIKKIIKN